MSAVNPQDNLVTRYREAIRAWKQPGIADAATLVGLSHREYCDRYVERYTRHGFTITTGTSNVRYDPHDAYHAALEAERAA